MKYPKVEHQAIPDRLSTASKVESESEIAREMWRLKREVEMANKLGEELQERLSRILCEGCDVPKATTTPYEQCHSPMGLDLQNMSAGVSAFNSKLNSIIQSLAL